MIAGSYQVTNKPKEFFDGTEAFNLADNVTPCECYIFANIHWIFR